MALITSGSVQDFSVTAGAGLRARGPVARGIDSVRVLSQTSDDFPAGSFEYAVSTGPRGIALQSIRLEKEAQHFLKRLFHKTSNVYFVAWAWDLSGQPLYMYPGSTIGAPGALIPLKVGRVRELLGSGALLFPARKVTSGLQLRIQIWESRGGTRAFGNAMTAVGSALEKSELASVLTLLAGVVEPVTIPISLVEHAAALLASVVGAVLESHGDDVLDFYEGNYPASKQWPRRPQSHAGAGTTIVLEHLR